MRVEIKIDDEYTESKIIILSDKRLARLSKLRLTI